MFSFDGNIIKVKATLINNLQLKGPQRRLSFSPPLFFLFFPLSLFLCLMQQNILRVKQTTYDFFSGIFVIRHVWRGLYWPDSQGAAKLCLIDLDRNAIRIANLYCKTLHRVTPSVCIIGAKKKCFISCLLA